MKHIKNTYIMYCDILGHYLIFYYIVKMFFHLIFKRFTKMSHYKKWKRGPMEMGHVVGNLKNIKTSWFQYYNFKLYSLVVWVNASAEKKYL